MVVANHFLFYLMRLDVFLKLSRLITRRSLAQEFCDAGLISVNGVTAKSAKEVKAGDAIEIRRRNRKTVIKIDTTTEKKQLSKTDSGSLYTIVSDESIETELP
jgi:ribosomal 50S subunit-recycling heat shock protein